MQAKSEFDFVSEKYVFFKEEPVFMVWDPNYSQAVCKQILALEAEKGSDYAFKILQRLSTGFLASSMREVNDMDVNRARILKKSRDERSSKQIPRGQKYRCDVCKKNFFDMNREVAQCPTCGQPKNECKKLS